MKLRHLTTTVRFRFDPIEVMGFGRSSGTRSPQRGFVADGVKATAADGRVTVHWLGTKYGREVSDWFFSSDPALAEVRALAIKMARAAAATAAVTGGTGGADG